MLNARDKRSRPGRALTAVVVLAGMLAAAGCSGTSPSRFNTPDRLERGLVLLLPGIEGEGLFSYAVRQGLDSAGVNEGLSIYNWGWPIPLAGPVLNQVDFMRARRVAAKISKEIAKYHRDHPGKPVHLVGHSGGGAIAVFAAEALAAGHTVDGIILLSPSLSAGYNLRKALAKSRKGIVHFWSPGDIFLLVLGTSVFGNIDGVHGPAAGATGFTNTGNSRGPFKKLYQRKWSQAMISSGHLGGHAGTTGGRFVQAWVAPWIKRDHWPVSPGGATSAPATSAPATSAPATEPSATSAPATSAPATEPSAKKQPPPDTQPATPQ